MSQILEIVDYPKTQKPKLLEHIFLQLKQYIHHKLGTVICQKIIV